MRHWKYSGGDELQHKQRELGTHTTEDGSRCAEQSVPVPKQPRLPEDPLDRPPVPSPPQPVGVRGAFRIQPVRYPWPKDLLAAVSVGVPLLGGALIGRLDYGLLASMGGFISLYVHNEPYAKRVRKLAIILIGLAVALGLGSVLAVSPWTMALALGGVSFGSTFLAGAWRVPPPSGYFFVLVCAVGTGLPVDLASVPTRVGVLLFGGGFTWLVAMAGWLRHPHGPEISAVANAYQQVAAFLAAIGTNHVDSARHNATLALRNSEAAVAYASNRWLRGTVDAEWVLLLNLQANAIFLAGIAVHRG